MTQSLEQGKRKLAAKDAITAGALGAVCIAIRFLFMLVGGVSPYVWFATHFIDAILIGPVFMLMVAKVRKNGPFLLTSLVTGVVLVAATWMFPLTGLVGGIAEYRNSWGSGHGKASDFEPLFVRHAKLAVGSSITLVEYLWDTYLWRKDSGRLS